MRILEGAAALAVLTAALFAVVLAGWLHGEDDGKPQPGWHWTCYEPGPPQTDAEGTSRIISDCFWRQAP